MLRRDVFNMRYYVHQLGQRGKNICYPEVLMFQEWGEAEAAIWEYFTAVPFYLILFTSNPSFSPCITHNVTIKIVPINTIIKNIFKISTCWQELSTISQMSNIWKLSPMSIIFEILKNMGSLGEPQIVFSPDQCTQNKHQNHCIFLVF